MFCVAVYTINWEINRFEVRIYLIFFMFCVPSTKQFVVFFFWVFIYTKKKYRTVVIYIYCLRFVHRVCSKSKLYHGEVCGRWGIVNSFSEDFCNHRFCYFVRRVGMGYIFLAVIITIGHSVSCRFWFQSIVRSNWPISRNY